jgi:hypothetical protein
MDAEKGAREQQEHANSLRYTTLDMTTPTSRQWICTQQMAFELGVHRVTLQRLKAAGYFRSGHHFRKANPLAPRSNTVWHQQRVLMRMEAG